MESMTLSEERIPPGTGGIPWLKVGAGIVGVALLVLVGRSLGGALPDAVTWIRELGVWGGVAFVGLYAVAAVAMAPGSILTLAAGAIFGLALGVFWVFIGATLGAALAFLVARYVARGWVEGRIAGSPRFAAVDRAIGRDGRKIVFLLRLSPLFPFNLMNYGLGLTRVRFVDYVVASVGMLPGTLLYVYYGKVAGDVASAAAGAGAASRGVGYWLVLALGLAATVAVTTVVTRAARRALAGATGEVDA
jgi:uncharacterized membrane protein YdjX (TVP38/TMEM64 family)